MDRVELIEKLSVTEEAKEVLRKVNRVASSSNPLIKASIKNLFVTCPYGAALSDYARVYEKIIVENAVYRVVGKGTYLELAFPKMGTEKDYADFYNSTRIVAATINDYVGVFLVSFEQWSGYNELVREEALSEFLKFVDCSKKNISFVFHVLPEFTDKEKLYFLLSGHVNLKKVELINPDLGKATDFIINELKKTDITFTDSAKRKLGDFISEKVDITSPHYLGYRTLERLSKNIIFEASCILNEEQNGNKKIDVQMLEQLSVEVDFSLDEKDKKSRLGFM
jgi:hypothetical protein